MQRVRSARVEVAGETVGAIERGLVAFVGVAAGDADADRAYVVGKVCGLRIFPDEAGKMARSLADVGGALLVISQFTLLGDVRRGLRPEFTAAMEPGAAEREYERFVAEARARGITVATGRFGADMRVLVDNDGPVTVVIDSRRPF